MWCDILGLTPTSHQGATCRAEKRACSTAKGHRWQHLLARCSGDILADSTSPATTKRGRWTTLYHLQKFCITAVVVWYNNDVWYILPDNKILIFYYPRPPVGSSTYHTTPVILFLVLLPSLILRLRNTCTKYCCSTAAVALSKWYNTAPWNAFWGSGNGGMGNRSSRPPKTKNKKRLCWARTQVLQCAVLIILLL